jgi:formylmethanofuran dehydrogenase subunit E
MDQSPMETIIRCQLCGNKAYELDFWFDKMLCRDCYDLSRSRSDIILETTN